MSRADSRRTFLLLVAALGLGLPACAGTRHTVAGAEAAPSQQLVRPPDPAISGPAAAAPPEQAGSAGQPGPGPAADRDTWAEMEVRLRRDILLSLDDYGHHYAPG